MAGPIDRRIRKKRRGQRNHSVRFKDHTGREHEVTAFEDYDATRDFLHRLDSLVAAKVARRRLDADMEQWLSVQSSRLLSRLADWGILDRDRAANGRPLKDHLADYLQSLRDKGDSDAHVKLTESHISEILDGCDFQYHTDIDAGRVMPFLRTLNNNRHNRRAAREAYKARNDNRNPNESDLPSDGDPISARAVNLMTGAFKAFCKWMLQSGRSVTDPSAMIPILNVDLDRRRERRALTNAECVSLLRSTSSKGKMFGLTADARVMVYRLALEAGFRANEIRTLKRSDFNLNATPATVTVHASNTKAKRTDTLPLRAGLASSLQAFMADMLPTAKPFATMSKKTANMLRADLVGVELEADEEGDIDFHSLRHTFCSMLAAHVMPAVLKKLARHAKIETTLKYYTHIRIVEQSTALDKLPDFSVAEMEATGTDDEICPEIAPSGTENNGKQWSENTKLAESDEVAKAGSETSKVIYDNDLQEDKNGGSDETRTRSLQIDSQEIEYCKTLPNKNLQGRVGRATRNGPDLSDTDRELRNVITAWPDLPDHIRMAIMALVRTQQ